LVINNYQVTKICIALQNSKPNLETQLIGQWLHDVWPA